jgi:peptidoglycan/xylan/chitin deacetylase (PgdA/CDA1 family)
MDHKRLNSLTADEIFSQLDVASNFIENTIGVRPTVFRPPYGATNSFVAETAAGIGYPQILWNGGAPRMESKRDEIINGVTGQANRAISNNRGLVLLFHDCSGYFTGMITALPSVIQLLQNKGFEFVAIE